MDYVIQELKNYYGLDWQNLVASGELGRLKAIFLNAKKDNEEFINDFYTNKKDAISLGKTSFVYKDKEYDLSEETEKKFLRYHSKKGLERRKALYAYRHAEQNSWIYKTLLEKKKLPLFKKCSKLLLVGSGLYPYSLFDIHKKFKHIKMLGIEIEESRYSASKQLVEGGPARDKIKILKLDGIDFDYSRLEDDDLVFISCDVDSDDIYKKVLETSKAHVYICAPYNRQWMKDSIKKSNLIYDKDGRIISP